MERSKPGGLAGVSLAGASGHGEDFCVRIS